MLVWNPKCPSGVVWPVGGRAVGSSFQEVFLVNIKIFSFLFLFFSKCYDCLFSTPNLQPPTSPSYDGSTLYCNLKSDIYNLIQSKQEQNEKRNKKPSVFWNKRELLFEGCLEVGVFLEFSLTVVANSFIRRHGGI